MRLTPSSDLVELHKQTENVLRGQSQKRTLVGKVTVAVNRSLHRHGVGGGQTRSRVRSPHFGKMKSQHYFTCKVTDIGNNVIIPPAGGYNRSSCPRWRSGYFLVIHAKKFSGAKHPPVFPA